jgi:hypothetical protein
MDKIRTSAMFQSFAAEHPGVDLWEHEGYNEDGWTYYSIVSKFAQGSVRILAYVRLQDEKFERRTYDEAGDDLWLPAE